jgi:16S rRNA (guanine966-N2)-methyltransferase
MNSKQNLGHSRFVHFDSQMRIIAGKFRSRQLTAPKGWKTRPTSDRLRETLFNVLAPQIEGAVFADLFAGTGAIGIEALSRGARRVYFAENARPPLAALRGNLEKLNVQAEAEVESAGTLPLLRRLLNQGIRLDIVFMDPPYSDRAAYQTTLEFLAEQPILSADGLVVAEHSRREGMPNPMGRLQTSRTIEQGEAALTLFRCRT